MELLPTSRTSGEIRRDPMAQEGVHYRNARGDWCIEGGAEQ